MVDQGLDIRHGFFFSRGNGKRMVRFIRSWWHMPDALLNDPEALPHFFHAYHGPVIAIPIAAQWDLKFKLVYPRIRALLAVIKVKAGGTQARACDAPFY